MYNKINIFVNRFHILDKIFIDGQYLQSSWYAMISQIVITVPGVVYLIYYYIYCKRHELATIGGILNEIVKSYYADKMHS